MVHMTAAVQAGGLDPEVEAAVMEYFDRAATAMINQPEEGPGA